MSVIKFIPTKVIFFSIALSVCHTAAASKQVLDIDAEGAAGCQFLGQVSATKYSGMLFAGAGLKGAQNKVRKRAAKLGASHIEWGALAAGGPVQAASAKAYLCQ